MIFCWRRRGGQLKGVVVKQMLFRPGIREGLVHGSVNFSCPRFFLLLNMNDVDGFKALWWLFITKSVLEIIWFLDWVSCCSITLTFLCLRSLRFTIYWSIYSKDPKTMNGALRYHFHIIVISLINISVALVFNFSFACLAMYDNNAGVLQLFMWVGYYNFVAGRYVTIYLYIRYWLHFS